LGAKVQSQKGNSPDRMLRSLNYSLVVKEIDKQKQPGGGLGSSHVRPDLLKNIIIGIEACSNTIHI